MIEITRNKRVSLNFHVCIGLLFFMLVILLLVCVCVVALQALFSMESESFIGAVYGWGFESLTRPKATTLI